MKDADDRPEIETLSASNFGARSSVARMEPGPLDGNVRRPESTPSARPSRLTPWCPHGHRRRCLVVDLFVLRVVAEDRHRDGDHRPRRGGRKDLGLDARGDAGPDVADRRPLDGWLVP